jgi:hypothetical protein
MSKADYKRSAECGKLLNGCCRQKKTSFNMRQPRHSNDEILKIVKESAMKLMSIAFATSSVYGKTPELLLAFGEPIHDYSWDNGAVKTTLLNALLGFVREIHAAFASEDQLINKRAITEAKLKDSVECWVEVGLNIITTLPR